MNIAMPLLIKKNSFYSLINFIKFKNAVGSKHTCTTEMYGKIALSNPKIYGNNSIQQAFLEN